MVWFSRFCHPEPGPELDSGSIDFGISVLVLNLGFKAPPVGGALYYKKRLEDETLWLGKNQFLLQ